MTKRLSPDPDLDALVKGLNNAARGESPAPAADSSSPFDDADEEVDASIDSLRPAGDQNPPRWKLPLSSAEGLEYIEDLLSRARKAEASDVLLVCGAPPMLRRVGTLEPMSQEPLGEGLTGLLCGALTPVHRRAIAQQKGAADFSYTHATAGRCRINVHRQRQSWAAAIRLLADGRPTLESLQLPVEIGDYAEREHGLVLVTGPTGSGKSSTLAALLRRVIEKRRVHVITVEDPVEFEHPHGESVVEHIEVGGDVPSFADALRSAMRQDPDVLLVGEMRDAESISIAITAAETGHLVFSTLHTADAPQSIHRILDSYDPVQQPQIRAQISASVAGVISQQLLPRSDGKGRVPAVENLVFTPAVRNLVRQGKVQILRSQLTLEQRVGMISLDRSLAHWVQLGIVDESEATFRCRNEQEFRQYLRS